MERVPPERLSALAMVVIVAIVILGPAGLGLAAYSRPVPTLEAAPMTAPTVVPGTPAEIPWPAEGSATVAVLGLGLVGATNESTAFPLASLTKVMTALVILEEHPLAPGEAGPQVRLTFDDVSEYLLLAGEDQSVAPMREGDLVTQRQMLEALLVPSGNNYANLLARWDAGSVEAFVPKMNAKAEALGMTGTHYADASGISPESVGTAADQLLLAQVALRNPVFAEIVRMQETTLPYGGPVPSTNLLLGTPGVVGVKTGQTDEAGGCAIIAFEREVAGRTVEVLSVVLGQPTKEDALEVSTALVTTVAEMVQEIEVLPQGAVVSTLEAAWGESTQVVAADAVRVLTWAGMPVNPVPAMPPVEAPLEAGDEVGVLTLEVGEQRLSVPLEATGPVAAPSRIWRIFR